MTGIAPGPANPARPVPHPGPAYQEAATGAPAACTPATATLSVLTPRSSFPAMARLCAQCGGNYTNTH
jgi:hypothetical protein